MNKKRKHNRKNPYFGSHNPVRLFLRVPLGQRFCFTGAGATVDSGPTVGAGATTGIGINAGIDAGVFGSHNPVRLFLRVPFGQRFKAIGGCA